MSLYQEQMYDGLDWTVCGHALQQANKGQSSTLNLLLLPCFIFALCPGCICRQLLLEARNNNIRCTQKAPRPSSAPARLAERQRRTTTYMTRDTTRTR